MLVVDQIKPLLANIQSLVAPAQAQYVAAHSAQLAWFSANLAFPIWPSAAAVVQLQADQATSNAANKLVLDLIAYALTISNWALNQDQRTGLGLSGLPFPAAGVDVTTFAAAQKVSLVLPAPTSGTVPTPPAGSIAVAFGTFLAIMSAPQTSVVTGQTLRTALSGDTVPVGSVVPAPDGHSYERLAVATPFGTENYYVQIS